MTDRREAIRLLGALALAPMPALGLASAPARAATIEDVPSGPQRLTRIVERGLSDGKSILVTRQWECRFASSGRGILVDGRQLSCEVEAPPALAAFADIERRREVTGLFPALLDPQGWLAGHGEAGDAGVDAAVNEALKTFARALDPSAMTDARQYLAQISNTAAAIVSAVPPDLFFPTTGERSEERHLPLPGGKTGTLQIFAKAQAHPQSGLLQSAEKRIVTRVGASERIAREDWSLGPN